MKFNLMQKPQDNLDLFNLDKIIFEKINRIKELAEEIERKDFELEILDEDIQEFHQKIKKKNKNITNLDQLVRQKEGEITNLDQLVRQKEGEITNLDQLVRQKDTDLNVLTNALNNKNYELIETREEITQIHNSIIFRFSKNISKKVDSIFPNNSKRGEFKKIVIASIILIQQKGLRKYILGVKDKIRRKEFNLNTIDFSNSNLAISEKDKTMLIKKVQDNHKNRLKIRPSSKSELQNDGFIIPDDKELI